jgi:hypothetical protein
MAPPKARLIPLALNVLGRLLALTPEPRPARAFGGRRRAHPLAGAPAPAGPALEPAPRVSPAPRSWRRRIARESSRRLVETALLSLAAPYLSERRIRTIARLGPSVEAFARDLAARPRPVVLATLHLALWESQTWLKLLSPVPSPSSASSSGPSTTPRSTPSSSAPANATACGCCRARRASPRRSRSCGPGLRRRPLRPERGDQGALTLLFGRVCSSTELPGLLAAKFGAELRTFYPGAPPSGGSCSNPTRSERRHRGGGHAGAQPLARGRPVRRRPLRVVALGPRPLEEPGRARPRRLRLEAKRNLLAADLSRPGPSSPPAHADLDPPAELARGRRHGVPLLRALRASRPDAEMTLLTKPVSSRCSRRLASPTRPRPAPARVRATSPASPAARILPRRLDPPSRTPCAATSRPGSRAAPSASGS